MSIYLKKASEKECDLLFSWANEEEVRKNSFCEEKILYESHVKWFNNKTNSDRCIIYILYFEETPKGQARIDIENKNAIISYSVDKNHRGKGLALKMLTLLEEEINSNKININKLTGYVKFDNIASQKIFQNLQYDKITHDSFLEYYKLL